jgi:hypothetical protein
LEEEMGSYSGELKCNLKSVRMTDTVYHYIQDFQGEGFNQKFENLVLYFKESEERKQQELLCLDKQIEEQQKTLRDLEEKVDNYRNFFRNIDESMQNFQKLLKMDKT